MPTSSPAPTVTPCLECQTSLSPAETQGLCARCLLRMGLASQFGEASVAEAGTRRIVPPPLFPFEFGGYRVLRLLGRGGMGAVYEGEQLETGRRVALKVLGHTIDSPEMRRRFLREGRLAASVNHPNSVYLFGTEEIDGAPVIVMELVAGGTLRDRLRQGPLLVREAVEAILQVIAGLEAAASAGVLHRDVKPANCFVSPDGTVKVGDFGLSVSTLAHDDSQLTASGVMLGTPSFAPPEQLRGEELDVRADIYSVGATLYALLTGQPPHSGDNAVQVVAAVLDLAPKPLSAFRADVPAGLAQIITRCLAKKRQERFADYAALRTALLPFSTNVAEPAPLGLRFIASTVDTLCAFFPNLVLVIMQGRMSAAIGIKGDTPAGLGFLATLAFAVAYYAFSEARFGTTPGKALCGLQVAGPDGGAPSPRRAGWRALLFVLASEASTFLHWGAAFFGPVGQSLSLGLDWVGLLIFGLLYVSLRRRNGFAALYELASGTRTVVRSRTLARPRLELAPITVAEVGGEKIGPYRVLGPLRAERWLAAHDDLLRRAIWIRLTESGAPPLDHTRREIGRVSRLRWIAGKRSEQGGWDAFEAPPGRPLREIAPQPWSTVRSWLHDLARELDASAKEGTLRGEIGLDHVWIAADGPALLLDEAWPQPERAPLQSVAEPVAAQQFLASVAGATLAPPPPPLHARAFLEKLRTGAFDRLSFVVGNLQSLLGKVAVVTRRRRLATLVLLPGFALSVAVGLTLMILSVEKRVERLHPKPKDPQWRRLLSAAQLHEQMADARKTGIVKAPIYADLFGKRIEQLDVALDLSTNYISGHFTPLVQAADFESEATRLGFKPTQREIARRAVAERPTVTPSQLAVANQALDPALDAMEHRPLHYQQYLMPSFFAVMLLGLGAGNVLGVLFFGIDPVLHLFGLAVVNRAGAPASRWRLLLRCLLIWGPALLAGHLLGIYLVTRHSYSGLLLFAFGLIFFSILLGTPWAILRPSAGLHDRLARARLVPR